MMMRVMAVVLYAVLTAPFLAMAVWATFVHNRHRYRRVIHRHVYPMLGREGLRVRDDQWESPAVVAELREYRRGVGQEEDTPPVRPAGATMRDVMRAEALPVGPYLIHDEGQARKARAFYEAEDWHGADAWIGYVRNHRATPYHYSRENAWKNEILDLYGLSDQPTWILDGIGRRADAISFTQGILFPGAYVLACAESRRGRDKEQARPGERPRPDADDEDDEDW